MEKTIQYNRDMRANRRKPMSPSENNGRIAKPETQDAKQQTNHHSNKKAGDTVRAIVARRPSWYSYIESKNIHQENTHTTVANNMNKYDI